MDNYTLSNATFANDTETDRLDPVENALFGTIFIVYTVCYIVPYLACVYIFATDPEMKSRACYRIILHIGISDIIQILANGICGGIFTLMRDAPFQVNKRIGSILEGSWMSYSSLANLLAFNRFVQVCFSYKADRIFTKQRTTFMIALCWLYGFTAFIVYNTPYVNILYSMELYSWGYDANEESVVCGYVEMALDLFQLACMVVWYIGIFVGLVSQKKKTSQATISRKEYIVVIQSMLICLMILATCFGFFVVPHITMNRYATFVCNLIWLTNCGCNPVIYIAFNSSLRRKLLDMLGRCSSTEVVSIRKRAINIAGSPRMVDDQLMINIHTIRRNSCF